MIFINLDSLETVQNFCRVNEKYRKNMDIDIHYGRWIIDGSSILGVASLLGNIVKVVPVTDDILLKHYYYKEIQKVGAYITKGE